MGPHRHRYLACAMLGLLLPLTATWPGRGIDRAITAGLGLTTAAPWTGLAQSPDHPQRRRVLRARRAAAHTRVDTGLPCRAKRV